MGVTTREREARAAASLALSSGRGNDSATTSRSAVAAPAQSGSAIYLGSCASCHEEGRQVSSGTALQLPLAIAVHEVDPSSLIRIIREGIVPAEGEHSRWMPPFAGALTDEQITSLVIYLRTFAPEALPWQDVAEKVAQAGQQ